MSRVAAQWLAILDSAGRAANRRVAEEIWFRTGRRLIALLLSYLRDLFHLNFLLPIKCRKADERMEMGKNLDAKERDELTWMLGVRSLGGMAAAVKTASERAVPLV